MKVIYSIAICLFTINICAQNLVGERYNNVLEEAEFYSTNESFHRDITKNAASIHLVMTGADSIDLEFAFEDSICIGVIMKYTCKGCFEKAYIKYILEGIWQGDSDGKYHSWTKNITVQIQSIHEPPYCTRVVAVERIINDKEYRALKKENKALRKSGGENRTVRFL